MTPDERKLHMLMAENAALRLALQDAETDLGQAQRSRNACQEEAARATSNSIAGWEAYAALKSHLPDLRHAYETLRALNGAISPTLWPLQNTLGLLDAVIYRMENDHPAPGSN